MGSSTDAHCYNCGLDEPLKIGGGMRNHETYAAWPVSCPVCKTVTTPNTKATPLTCLKCGSEGVEQFDAPMNWRGDGVAAVRWGMFESSLTLTDGHYRCPHCGEFELRFGTNYGQHPAISWD
jgi:predicted RNA-binding Zn-ribbon protein involved in translation (DUF1610 family)